MSQPAQPIRLIVNADDLGWSTGITKGILEGHRRGIITSSTLAANMPFCEDAIAQLPSVPNLGVGIHLNACQGPALSPHGRAVLAGADGQMNSSGAGVIQRCLLHARTMLPAIEEEFTAQVERALSLGLVPTHLDSHRHVHGWPPIFSIVRRLCGRYHIPHVRWHQEVLDWGRVPPYPPKQRRLSRVLNWLGRRCRRQAGGLIATAGTLGVAHTGLIDVAFLLGALEGLPAGTTEIMVHPGYAEDVGQGQTRLRASRRAELEALCDERVKQRIAQRGIVLIHYGQLE